MLTQRPEKFSGADQRIAAPNTGHFIVNQNRDETGWVAFLEIKLQSPPGEIGMTGQVHSAQDGVRLTLGVGKVYGTDPGDNVCGTLLITRRQQAIHLGGFDEIIEKLIGNFNLHGRFEQRSPIVLRSGYTGSIFQQQRIIIRCDLPGGQIDRAWCFAVGRQCAGENDFCWFGLAG
ncbi:MAG: hypothetical protein BWY71_02043 [Planctomycetes bacterium ADurb.Bin412]|nr:MAG: hypothetical protein BWY71_02043 [Planctomycetes bacterium ADurb.Bin412]